MATFVLEIGSEELPARFLNAEEAELKARFTEALDSLEHGEVRVMSTPRRAVVLIENVSPTQQETEETVTGPPVRVAYSNAAPTKALEGFVRTHGLTVEDAFVTHTEKGDYVAVKKRAGGATAKDMLAQICPAVIISLPFAKRMRWGTHSLAYARPLRWILALLDDEVPTFTIGPLTAGRETYGHRVHGNGPFSVRHAKDWFAAVSTQGGIVPDKTERRKIILEKGNALATALDGRVIWKDSLLDEVQGLTERPVPLLADFDPVYLELPRQVLLTSMEHHQKCFGIEGADSRLLPHFLAVLNICPEDMTLVRRGWERVLRARLEDARFFWRADLRENFEQWCAKLDQVVFVRNLGTMGDKTHRLEALCRHLAEECAPDIAHEAARAGRLSKADLVTGLVGEFDVLQGIMGGIYAARKGETDVVADALREQYLPAGPDSPLPKTPAGALLSLADKADTLAGCFGLGMIPTGAADPNGLRRCALGIIRIALDFNFSLDIREIFTVALTLYAEQGCQQQGTTDALADKLTEFLFVRLRAYFQNQGFDTPVVDAALGVGANRLSNCRARLSALAAFSREPEYAQAVQTFKRVANILRKQTVSGGVDASPAVWDDALLREESEKALAATLHTILPLLDALWTDEDHGAALHILHTLRPGVDAFFDCVMVLCEDDEVRRNRLGMLNALRARFERLADFAVLQA